MEAKIICFAGRIKSGKTTISKALSKVLDYPHASFGDYLRDLADKKGLDKTRATLQEIGASLMENEDQFCISVLNYANWKKGQNLIVDGIRHASMLNALREHTKPSKIIFIFIDIDENVLSKRSAGEKKDVEKHSTEQQVLYDLPNMADLVLNGTRPVDSLVSKIINWINQGT